MTHEVVIDDDGVVDLRPPRFATVETTPQQFYDLTLHNLKESEAREAIDILKARKLLDG
jgi:hypothetical protein